MQKTRMHLVSFQSDERLILFFPFSQFFPCLPSFLRGLTSRLSRSGGDEEALVDCKNGVSSVFALFSVFRRQKCDALEGSMGAAGLRESAGIAT